MVNIGSVQLANWTWIERETAAAKRRKDDDDDKQGVNGEFSQPINHTDAQFSSFVFNACCILFLFRKVCVDFPSITVLTLHAHFCALDLQQSSCTSLLLSIVGTDRQTGTVCRRSPLEADSVINVSFVSK